MKIVQIKRDHPKDLGVSNTSEEKTNFSQIFPNIHKVVIWIFSQSYRDMFQVSKKTYHEIN